MLTVGIEGGGRPRRWLAAPWSRIVQPRREWFDDFRPARSICISRWISPEVESVMASVASVDGTTIDYNIAGSFKINFQFWRG
jgi:hypothetical protein